MMTLISSFGLVPPICGASSAPQQFDLSDLSLIIPVKNNPQGLHRLLTTCLEIFSPQHCPREILVIDNLSSPPLEISWHASWGLPVNVLACTRPGPAAARNLGARHASGHWLLFLDSDCIPTSTLISGYQQALCGAIAYAGVVRAAGTDLISQYYDAQNILNPLPLWDQEGIERPAYLITANAFIWREAFLQVGGFDEHFPWASGEDIDLAMRLWAIGPLAYAPQAQVLHAFEPEISTFVRRFVRYGRGNHLLSQRYHVDLTPHPFPPCIPSLPNSILARLQYLALWWGYQTMWGKQVPPPPLPIPQKLPASEASSGPLASSCMGTQYLAQKLPASEASSVPPLSRSGSSVQKKKPEALLTVGIFIDGDNQTPSRLEMIVKIASFLGTILVCRVYCASPSPKWQQACTTYGAELRQIPHQGKVDPLLSKDAQTYCTTLQVFLLVSDDGDFAETSHLLQPCGRVVGLGSAHASKQFQKACDPFVPLPTKTDKASLTHLFHQNACHSTTPATPAKKS